MEPIYKSLKNEHLPFKGILEVNQEVQKISCSVTGKICLCVDAPSDTYVTLEMLPAY
jgi:hypothetical protein